MSRVKALQPWPEGENIVVLQDGRQFVSTRTARELRQKLQFAPTG